MTPSFSKNIINTSIVNKTHCVKKITQNSIKLNNTEIGNLDIFRNKKKKQLSFFQRIKNYLLDIL